MIWILFFIIVIGLIIAVTVYFSEESKSSKKNDISKFELWIDPKYRATNKLSQILEKVPGNSKILFNVHFPIGHNMKKIINTIFIHESGIYIIDLKQFDGWIYGREQDEKWSVVKFRDKIKSFPNPFTNSKRIITIINELFPQVQSEDIRALVVFTENSYFKKIEFITRNMDVLNISDLKKYWISETEKRLSNNDISVINDTLSKYAQPLSTDVKKSQR